MAQMSTVRASYQSHKGIKFGGRSTIVQQKCMTDDIRLLREALDRMEQATTEQAYVLRLAAVRQAYVNMKAKF